MKNLDNVTLIAYTSIEFDATIRSLMISSSELNFAEVKLVSHEKPKNLPDKIKWEYGPKINNIDDFNWYMFRKFYWHVDTSYALYVQHHAWVEHPELWDDSWLDYSYIGAPWRVIPNTYITNMDTRARVGNGGFSLRSRKLMMYPEYMNWPLREEQGWRNEDGNLCCYYRKELEEAGFKFAPVEVAATFAFENFVDENANKQTFGFHRNRNPYN